MENVLLFFSAASALCAISALPAHEYHFVYEMKNWTDAQSYCRENYVDLATINNMDEVTMLSNMVDLSQMSKSSDSSRAWIGLYDDLNSWRWSMSNPNFYPLDEKNFRNWNLTTAEPNNYGGKESCGAILNDGSWQDLPCSLTLQSICSDISGTNATFISISTAMTWSQAQSYCRQYHTDLASIRTTSENQEVNTLVASGQKVWIGLFRNYWNWTDGTTSSFRYWNDFTNEPNGATNNCAVTNLKNSGKWEAWACSRRTAFICYCGPVKKVVKVRLSSSSVNMTDPAVMEDLINQFKQKLKGQGVDGVTKLSWRKTSDGHVFNKVSQEPEEPGDTEPDEL